MNIFKTVFLIFIVSPALVYAGADKPIGNGTFIQAWFSGSWDDTRWQQEFEYMKEAGMQYLVIGPVTDCSPGKVTTTLYPSSLPNTELSYCAIGKDYVETVLKNAEASGIKVFVEVSLNTEWWLAQSHDTTWLYPQMRLDRDVCDELWSLYKGKYPNAFYGWYFAYEENNIDTQIQKKRDILANAMNILLDHLTATDKHLPFMWCPYMVARYCTPEVYGANWEDIFSKLHTEPGDIFCPQDCVIGGDITLDNIDDWFAAYRKAVDTKPGLLLWSDLLTFDMNGGLDYLNAPLDRVVKQYQIEQPYVDDYITFAYSHYNSPYNVDPGYHQTYMGYVNTGVLESEPPSAPQNFTTVVDAAGTVTLSWDASSDNIGVFGYIVLRDGKPIWKRQTGRQDGRKELDPLPTTMIDGCLAPDKNYTYEVRAYDFANNMASSSPVTVKTPDGIYLPNKISVGSSYTVSIKASDMYPDPDGKKLTNGSFGRSLSKADPAFEGVYDLNKNQRDIIIDLGIEQPVQQFIAYYLYDTLSSIYLPRQVKVYISSDNVIFTEAGALVIPNIVEGTTTSLNKCVGTLSRPVNARYVKFRVNPLSEWTFDNEFEVRNNAAVSVAGEDAAPVKFSLLQNYPNPFNPSTTISYTIPQNCFVALKIYDILGNVVETLVNENQPAGNYSVSACSTGISSGVYFYKLTAGSFSSVKKLIKLK